MDIVCVGDCGIDRYLNSNVESIGGCTLNVAMNLILPADGTMSASVVTALSSVDERSKEISDLIANKRIALCASLLPGKLPVQNIFLEQNGERTFKGYEPGILANWNPSKFQSEIIAQADVVITLAFEQFMSVFDAILAVPRQGMLVVDFMDMVDFGKDIKRIDGYISQTDIAFFGLSKRTDQKLINDIRQRYESASSSKLAVITFGSEGSMVVGPGVFSEQPAEPVTSVVDTTGAGDSFAAAFISTFLAGESIPKALKIASLKAASVVQMMGAY